MRRVFKGLLSLILLVSFARVAANCGSCGDCCNDNSCISPCDGYPYLAYRSQGVDAARELVGWQQFINKYDMDSTYGAFYAGVEYTRTFREKQIAQFLFGSDLTGNCCNTLLIQGGDVENRNCKAWLADYFGLPEDFSSEVTFCPRIENVVVDLSFYVGLDEVAEGLYFRIFAPITWSRWNLNMCENVLCEGGTQDFLPGYMNAEGVERSALPCNFTDAIDGCKTWGDMQTGMKHGRMRSCKDTKTRLADIHVALGWNFVRDEDYMFGLNIQATAPTGNKPCGAYLFEPIVGNGGHWELGAGLNSSWIWWRSEETEDHYFGMWFDANITHLFKTCQCRSFDFCGKPNSRYMLLEQMGSNPAGDNQILGENGEGHDAANYRYQQCLVPAINFTTFNIDVKIDVQADLVFKLGWVKENWSFDLGYNLWARTGEKFCLDDDCCCCGCPSDACYAIKGDAYIYGYDQALPGGTAYPLSATQKCATIYGGRHIAVANHPQNPNIDNPLPAEVGPNFTDLVDFEGNRVNTSIQPELVTRNDINIGKSPSAITHKIFAHLSYAWKDKDENWVPFLGIGGFAEFSTCKDLCCDDCCDTSCNTGCNTSCNTGCNTSCNTNCCNTCCDSSCSSKKGGVSQWGIWIKGGVSFD